MPISAGAPAVAPMKLSSAMTWLVDSVVRFSAAIKFSGVASIVVALPAAIAATALFLSLLFASSE
jgi:hypothetical protein